MDPGSDNKKTPKYSGALYHEINKQWLYRPLGVCRPPPKFICYLFHVDTNILAKTEYANSF